MKNFKKWVQVWCVAALATFGVCSPPAFAAQTPNIQPKSVPLQVFRQLCLSSHGDNEVLASNLKKMKAEYPNLLAELSAKHRTQLLGDDSTIGWIFTPAEAGKPFWIGASSSGLCALHLFGTEEQLKVPFENELQQFATDNGGEFHLTGGADFLGDKSKSGYSYTVEMPKSVADVMFVQSDENVDNAGHPIQLMSFFRAVR